MDPQKKTVQKSLNGLKPYMNKLPLTKKGKKSLR